VAGTEVVPPLVISIPDQATHQHSDLFVPKAYSIIEWTPAAESETLIAERMGNKVHLSYQEDLGIIHRKYELFSEGFYVLKDVAGDLYGYAIFHPWIYGEPPRLNQYFDRIQDSCDSLHLHDIVVADELRGRGHTSDFIRIFLEAAKNKGMPKATLVAVSGTESLWRHFGFHDLGLPSSKDALLSYSETSSYMARDI